VINKSLFQLIFYTIFSPLWDVEIIARFWAMGDVYVQINFYSTEDATNVFCLLAYFKVVRFMKDAVS